MHIKKFLAEATQEIKNKNEKNFVALCCTHYGFSESIFYDELKNCGFKNFDIINPNVKMVELIKKIFDDKKFDDGRVNIEVVSKTKITEEEINSIGEQIVKISPATKEALKNYKLVENLF